MYFVQNSKSHSDSIFKRHEKSLTKYSILLCYKLDFYMDDMGYDELC